MNKTKRGKLMRKVKVLVERTIKIKFPLTVEVENTDDDSINDTVKKELDLPVIGLEFTVLEVQT